MDNDRFAMGSEWMENGNIIEFIKAHEDANRLELVRFSLLPPTSPYTYHLFQLKDVACGLEYMHGKGMIHGDLKGVSFRKLVSLFCPLTRFLKANILIDQDGHARLADFGLLTIISDHTNFTASNSSTNAGTTRWMSPELLNPEEFDLEKCQRTKESDCYALGMVLLEVLSGQPPFPRDANHTVILKVTKGDRPARPQGAEGAWFTDDLWEILEMCWSPWPRSRPTVEVVFDCLKRVSTACRLLPLSVGGNAEADTGDEHSFTASGPGTFPYPIPNLSLTSR